MSRLSASSPGVSSTATCDAIFVCIDSSARCSVPHVYPTAAASSASTQVSTVRTRSLHLRPASERVGNRVSTSAAEFSLAAARGRSRLLRSKIEPTMARPARRSVAAAHFAAEAVVWRRGNPTRRRGLEPVLASPSGRLLGSTRRASPAADGAVGCGASRRHARRASAPSLGEPYASAAYKSGAATSRRGSNPVLGRRYEELSPIASGAFPTGARAADGDGGGGDQDVQRVKIGRRTRRPQRTCATS